MGRWWGGEWKIADRDDRRHGCHFEPQRALYGPFRAAFSFCKDRVLCECPGAVKGMILLIMAKPPLTARSIRIRWTCRKRPPTVGRENCKPCRRSALRVMSPVVTEGRGTQE